MNIALYGREYHAAALLSRRAAHGLLDHFKGRLCGLRRHEKLRQEERPLFKALAHHIEGGNQLSVYDVEGSLSLFDAARGLLRRLLAETEADCVNEGRALHALGEFRTADFCLLAALCRDNDLALTRKHIGLTRILRDIALALPVESGERQVGAVGRHHRLVVRVDDGAGEPALHGERKEEAVDQLALRQSEGDIADTEYRVPVQLVADTAQHFEGHICRVVVGRDGHREAVDDDVLRRDAVLRRARINLLRDANAALRILGDTILIESQAHDHAAVLCDQREYGLKALLLAVHGVDHGLAVVEAKTALQCLQIRRVELQRQRRDTLESGHHRLHHLRLVDLRKAHVHIQHVRAGLFLFYALLQDVLDIARSERLFKALLAGRVDALADDNGALAELHRLRERRDHGAVLIYRRFEGKRARRFDFEAYVLRRGAAAAAEHVDTEFRNFLHLRGEFLCPEIVVGHAVLRMRQPGIRIYNDGERADFAELFYDRIELQRSEAAVHTECIDPKALEHRRDALHRAAGQHLSLLVKDRCDKDRKIRVLLCREHRSLCLHRIGHGLDQHEIRPLFLAPAHRLRKNRDTVLKGEIAHRL